MRNYYQKFTDLFTVLEEKLNNKNTSRLLFIFFVLLFGGLILLLNLSYPLYADDWGYTFITGSELTRKISVISDIFESQYNHYFIHGGRVIAHMTAEFLLYLGGWKSDLLNSLAYVALVLIIYKTANFSKTVNASLFFIINILIYFFQPAFSQTILWITGSGNYLWMALIIISFIYVYVRGFLRPQRVHMISKALIMFIAGIIAGWTNENTAFGMFVILCLIVFYVWKEERFVPAWMLTGLLGALIGYVLMVAAPGNFVRYDQSLVDNSIEQGTKIKFYMTRMLPVVGDFYKFALSLVFIYIFALFTYLYFTPQKDKRTIYLSIVFFIGAIISDLVMVASPEFPPRAWFGIIIYLIIAISILYANIPSDNRYLFAVKSLICIFACIYFALSFQRGYKDLAKINDIFNKREMIINQQKDKANFDFVTKETINPQTGFPLIDEIPSDSTHWINMFYLRYHGIKSFKIEKQ